MFVKNPCNPALLCDQWFSGDLSELQDAFKTNECKFSSLSLDDSYQIFLFYFNNLINEVIY